MRPPRPEPGSGLPAPYEDPWRRLGAALGDVIASIGLRLRELWRRNGEGSLPRPRFWPGALASLFWPLLLAALLAVLLVVPGMVLSRRDAPSVSGSSSAPAASATPPVADAPSPTGATASATAPSAAPSAKAAGAAPGSTAAAVPPGELPSPPVHPGTIPSGLPEPPSGPSPDSPSAMAPSQPVAGAASGGLDRPGLPTAPRATAGADDQAGAGATSAAADGAGASGGAADDGAETALLQGLLGDGPPPAWAIGVESRAAEGLLRLCLDDGFAALPLVERQRLADRWLARGQELGYERLELVDGRHRPLGRTARVGSGMILLDSSDPRR